MFELLDTIDWAQLQQHKGVLQALRDGLQTDSPEAQALSGVLELVEQLQGAAIRAALWSSPDSSRSEEIEAEDEASLWDLLAPGIIYHGYPDNDTLGLAPPPRGETIEAFSIRAERAGDLLFPFLCHEAEGGIGAEDFLERLEGAHRDIDAVYERVRQSIRACPAIRSAPPRSPTRPDQALNPVTLNTTTQGVIHV